MGLLLAVCVALLLELSDRRIRAPDDVLAALGLPVLGTLPKPNAKRFIAGRHALAMQQHVLSLPSPSGNRGV